MLKGLLYTSIQFFESNPSGRILNRASKDQYIMDELLPATLLSGLVSLLIAIGSMFVIFLLNPFVLLILIILVPTVAIIIRFYHRSSYQLKRLKSITRSPVYALFLTSLNGLSNIRAFRAEESFIQLISSKMDVDTSAYINETAAIQWLALRLTLLCPLIVLVTSIQIVLFRHQRDSSEHVIKIGTLLTRNSDFLEIVRYNRLPEPPFHQNPRLNERLNRDFCPNSAKIAIIPRNPAKNREFRRYFCDLLARLIVRSYRDLLDDYF